MVFDGDFSKRESILVYCQIRNISATEISLHFGGGVLGGACLRLTLKKTFAEFHRKQIIVLK